MRLIKVLGVALVAVFAVSAMAATGASAHEFESSEIGLLVLGEAEGPQLFITPAGHLVCNTLTADGVVPALKSPTQLVTVSYTNCTVSVGAVTAKPDVPIVAVYQFHANGTVLLEKHVTILATVAGLKCTILVLPSGDLSSVKYTNINANKEILLSSHVREILSDATGAGCKSQYTNDRTGLYLGNAITKVDGGTTTWV